MQYGALYEKHFMFPSLKVLQGGKARFRVYDEPTNLGFKNTWINLVTYDLSHAEIYASNEVERREDGYTAGVFLNPEVFGIGKEQFKLVLAHEWIEIMMACAGGSRPADKRLTLEKIELAVMFNLLRRRSLWQDSTEWEAGMHAALRHLLVSRNLLQCLLAEPGFDMDIDQLRRVATESPTDTAKLVVRLVKAYSAKYSVDRETVHDRIQEILFDP